MDVRVEELQKMKAAFMRHVGPYMEVGETWGRLCAWAGPRGMLGPQTELFGVSHDDPAVTPPDKLRYDACLKVGGDFQGEGDVGVQDVGGGFYAVTRHVGPYEKLGETYNRLCGEWMPSSGKELRSAPAIEFYRNDPNSTPPEQLITDIYMPIEG